MFKRELKVNFKSFIIWTLLLIGIFMLVFLVYPLIINSPEMKSMDEMMNMFPIELLKAFNMDIASLDCAYGWLKSEGFVFVLLIIGCYAGTLGSNILLKEESDKTIEYLNSLPVKRTDIIISKVLVGIVYVTIMTLLLGIFNFVALTMSGSFDIKQFILLSITPLFPSFVIFFLCMFLSTFTHKTKKMLGISLGVVLLSYILNMLSSIAEVTEFLKYFSVFTLADIRNVISDVSINLVMILISLILSVLFFVLTAIRYNNKELV